MSDTERDALFAELEATHPRSLWDGVVGTNLRPLFALVVEPACECGASLHEGLHEGELACEDAERDGCTCGGYWDVETSSVIHDGYCELTPWPAPCECGYGCLAFQGCRWQDPAVEPTPAEGLEEVYA